MKAHLTSLRAHFAHGVLGFLLVGGLAWADVVVLKDGRRIEGKVVTGTDGTVKVTTPLGEQTFKRDEIAGIEPSKTRDQELRDRERAARTAEDFAQLGKWADEKKLKADAKRLIAKALELDPKNETAHVWLGHVAYKGEWMTPAERDARMEKDLEVEMLAKGLVRWQDQWVTPDEKAHFEKGEIFVDGQWTTFAAVQRRKGLELSGDQWYPRAEALARNGVIAAGQVAKIALNEFVGADAIVAGPYGPEFLAGIGAGLVKGRAWFDETYAPPKGLELFGGRMGELYVFSDNPPYLDTIPYFNAQTTMVPPGWADAVTKTHGFFIYDPYPISSARKWGRADEDLEGHCYHHWGHLLVARLGWDGRLLPPWYEEGVAALLEFRVHGRNAVFCRGKVGPDEPPAGPSTGGPNSKDRGTKVKKGDPPKTTVTLSADFNPRDLREGAWRGALQAGLKAGNVPAFDRLTTRQFTELESADIASAMGIVEWLESKHALRAFHDVLKKDAPKAPARVHENDYERVILYEKAFQAAVKMSTKDADEAWRQWFLSR